MADEQQQVQIANILKKQHAVVKQLDQFKHEYRSAAAVLRDHPLLASRACDEASLRARAGAMVAADEGELHVLIVAVALRCVAFVLARVRSSFVVRVRLTSSEYASRDRHVSATSAVA